MTRLLSQASPRIVPADAAACRAYRVKSEGDVFLCFTNTDAGGNNVLWYLESLGLTSGVDPPDLDRPASTGTMRGPTALGLGTSPGPKLLLTAALEGVT